MHKKIQITNKMKNHFMAYLLYIMFIGSGLIIGSFDFASTAVSQKKETHFKVFMNT